MCASCIWLFVCCMGSVCGDVKIVQIVVFFRFCCELRFWVQGIKFLKDHLYAGMGGIVYQ